MWLSSNRRHVSVYGRRIPDGLGSIWQVHRKRKRTEMHLAI